MKFIFILLFAFLISSCTSKVEDAPADTTASSTTLSSGQSISEAPPTPPSPATEGASCTLPRGEKLANGATQNLYQLAAGGCIKTCATIAKKVKCTNGVLSGVGSTVDTKVYTYASCTAPTNCNPCNICGATIESGGSRDCYNATKPSACGATCSQHIKKFKCDNGTIKNANDTIASEDDKFTYYHPTCNANAACSGCVTTSGAVIPNGQSAAFFQNDSVACGQSCTAGTNQVLLVCSNGTFANRSLYPNHIYNNCSPNCATPGTGGASGGGGGSANSLCPLPWASGMATDGTRVIAFSKRSVACGDSCVNYKAKITCNGRRGLWSGGATYIYNSCYEKKCP